MNAIPSHATYYIVGNEPIGLGFSPDKGRAMTAHADGTYTIECGSFNGYARFVFADSLAEAGDWDTFHASMRIGPETLQNISCGEWISTQKASGQRNDSGYRLYGSGGYKYLITFDPVNWRFRIDHAGECDFIKDGICYNIINDQEVSVTYYQKGYYNSWHYTGSITIPETVSMYGDADYRVTAIGDSAFYYCRNLTEIILPQTITSIGVEAFYASDIQRIDIPDPVTFIGERAFANNPALTEIKLPSNLTSILEGTFFYTGLTTIDIPNTVRFIGDAAFHDCYKLERISIPESVNSIRDFTFYLCGSLKEVSLPNHLAHIGYGAFAGCRSLREIELPASVTYVELAAFYECDSIETVRTPSLEAWCNIVFDDFEEYVSNPLYFAKHFIVGGEEQSPHLVIPEGVPVINMCSFKGFENLTSVIIPNSVKEICQSAFGLCPNLQEVSFGDSVRIIGNYAFECCHALQAVCLSTRLSDIGYFAFYHCKSLVGLELPDEVTSIGTAAFAECEALKYVMLGNALTTLPRSIFCYDHNLTNVRYNEALTTIDDYAF